MTHEHELTEPVDLCIPDGSRLAPEARGWSRRPLHRANLDGCFGTNKRWDYWAILAGDLVVSTGFSNVDHISLADIFWVDLTSGETGGHGIAAKGAPGFALPEVPGATPLRVEQDGLDLEIADDPSGTTFRVAWTERSGAPGRLDLLVEQPPGHESLNVVIPWSDTVFNFTSKHQARPAHGVLEVGDRRWVIGDGLRDPAGPSGATNGTATTVATGEAWGVLDVGRGRWPSEITWNWGGGAGRSGAHVVGIQIGGRWTDGTGFTENGVIVDGRLTKLGRELVWTYDWDDPLAPWRVTDPGGRLDLVLTPRWDKHTAVQGRKRGSETHQVFGTWAGEFTTDDGLHLTFHDLQGFAEEARQRW